MRYTLRTMAISANSSTSLHPGTSREERRRSLHDELGQLGDLGRDTRGFSVGRSRFLLNDQAQLSEMYDTDHRRILR